MKPENRKKVFKQSDRAGGGLKLLEPSEEYLHNSTVCGQFLPWVCGPRDIALITSSWLRGIWTEGGLCDGNTCQS